MTGEVAAGERGQCTIAIERLGISQPVAHENVSVLAANHRPAHREPAQTGEHEHVHECLTLGGNARRGNALAELCTSKRTFLAQAALDNRYSTLGGARRDTFLSKAPRVACEEARRREGVKPGVVLAANKVQRTPVQPRDQKRALLGQRPIDVRAGQARTPRTDRQAQPAPILALYGKQPLDDGHRIARRRPREQLRC